MLSVFSLVLLLSVQSIASNAYVCPSLEKPTHGRVVAFGNSVIAVYSCTYGYRLVGDGVRHCVKQDYSDYYYWTGSTPTCVKDCPAPVNPSNGQVVIKGGIAIYLCDRGYILVGSSLRTCKDGAWTGDAPKCVQDTKCSTLSNPPNGQVVLSDRGQLATYVCNKGYSIVGGVRRKCSNGRWNGSAPSCCQTLSTPSNGRVSVVGGRATYFCNDGYRLVGDHLRLCTNSTWNGTVPICMKEQCPTLSYPANGRVRVTSSGKRAWYTCSSGYTLLGKAFRSCIYGIWLGSAPVCVKVCPRLSSPANGFVRYQSKSTATYTCLPGFNLQGNRQRTCLHGVWTGSQPSCVPTCPRLANPSNGLVRVLGDTATYSCNSGFRLRGTSRRTCSGGVWSGSEPSCIRVCPRVSSPSNGAVTVVGDTATYRCYQGYKLLGNSRRTCSNGIWSGSEPTCERMCPSLGSLANGDVRVSGNGATYSCNLGYRLRGNRRRICSNGVWNGHEPSCDRICPNLRGPGNGAVQVSGIVATYSCNSGYDLRGNRRRICSNGVWSGSEPSCERICPNLSGPANGDVQVSGNVATYSCSRGYELRGNERRICSNGVWSGRQPSCVRTACIDGTEWRDDCNQLCTCVRGQPRCCRERKEIESMTAQELQLYIDTVITASTNPVYRPRYEAFLRIHRSQFGSGIHAVDQFLPWHRWFLLQYETLLRSINCKVTVPYWDWSLWAMTPFAAPIWGDGAHQIGGNGRDSGRCVQEGKFRVGTWSLPDGTCLSRQFRSGSLPGPVEVAEVLNYSPSEFRQFEIGLRVNLHNLVHCAIGGTMCSRDAGYAPEFFLHHGFIDKLWSDWQEESSDHHNAHFSTRTNPMTSTGSTSASDVIDNYNLPGGVSVCYADPINSTLEDVVIELRALSPAWLIKVTRPAFLSMTDDVFDVFGVSESDRKVAAGIDKDLRRGSLPAGARGVPGRSAIVSHAWNLQMTRLGFTMATVKAAGQ